MTTCFACIFMTGRDFQWIQNRERSGKQLDPWKKGEKRQSPAIPDRLPKKQKVGVNGVLSKSYCFKEFQWSGAPGQTRTGDPLLRRQTLYPTELRAHPWLLFSFYCACNANSSSTSSEILGALGATSMLGTVKPTRTRSASSRRRSNSNSIRE